MLTPITDRAVASGLNRSTALVLVLALVLSFLHHADHVLRVDHSGWPFRQAVTPFTYSLLAYPVILFALLGPRSLFWLRWILLAGAAGFVVFAHTMIEAPSVQFHMWAHNESVHVSGVSNALNVESAWLGYLAVAVGMALNVVAVVSAVMMLVAGLRGRARTAHDEDVRGGR